MAELRRHGVSPADVQRALAGGAATRAVRGVYLCAHAGPDQRIAVAAAGRLACVSVLRRAGVWVGLDRSLHLQLPPHASGERPTADETGRPIRYHWALTRFPDARERSWCVSPMDAAWQAIHCLDEENAIACLESAVHERLLTVEEVRRVCARAPARLHRGIRELEFTAGSGMETLVRRRLRHAGYTVVAQVRVGGIGDEDLLVEDCVALETDGEKWHGPDRFHLDRNRDLKTEGLGRRALRLTHDQVIYDWESTFLSIKRVVDDAKRDRTRRFGRVILGADDPL